MRVLGNPTAPFATRMLGAVMILAGLVSFIYPGWSPEHPWSGTSISIIVGVLALSIGVSLQFVRRQVAVDADAGVLVLSVCFFGLQLKKRVYDSSKIQRVLLTWSGSTSTTGAGADSRPSYYVQLKMRGLIPPLEIAEFFDQQASRTLALSISETWGIPIEPPLQSAK